MSRHTMTLEQLLKKTPDGDLLDIQQELLSLVVPATGCAHSFCRKVNKLIDRGDLCINPNTYRKVYLPTLAKAVQRELARRYTEALLNGMIVPGTVEQLEIDSKLFVEV